MKIIVTGSLGNISKPLTKALLEKGHSVTVISSKSHKQKEIEALGATAAIGTIEDVQFLTATFNGADAVYCMLPPFDYFDPNLDIMATTCRQVGNYCAAIRESGVKKIVHLSSIGAHLEKGNGLLAFHNLAGRLFKALPADVIIKHMRPVGFYKNLYDFKESISGKGFLGIFLTLRFSGFISLITGRTGVIAANDGADDKMPWVSPADIAAATAEELTAPFVERKFRYIASEELTRNEIAKIIGTAIGKPYLKWALISDKDMLGGLKMFKMARTGYNKTQAVMKWIILLFLPVLSFSQAKLVKITLLDHKAEIMVPVRLEKMTEEMWKFKYHQTARPILVLTDRDGEVNLIADYTLQPLHDEELSRYKDFQLSGLKENHPEIQLIDSAITTVNGKKIGYFKFISQATDQKIFNYYFFTIVDGKVLLFTFNCIERLRSKWEKTADDIVASLKIQ